LYATSDISICVLFGFYLFLKVMLVLLLVVDICMLDLFDQYTLSSTRLTTTVIAFQAQHNYIIFVNSEFLRNNLVETEIQ
jgi:hypothetical protein